MLGANNDHQCEPTAQNALNTRGANLVGKRLSRTSVMSHVTRYNVIFMTKLIMKMWGICSPKKVCQGLPPLFPFPLKTGGFQKGPPVFES